MEKLLSTYTMFREGRQVEKKTRGIANITFFPMDSDHKFTKNWQQSVAKAVKEQEGPFFGLKARRVRVVVVPGCLPGASGSYLGSPRLPTDGHLGALAALCAIVGSAAQLAWPLTMLGSCKLRW